MTPPQEVTTLRLRLPLVTLDERADMLAGRRRSEWHPDSPREDDRDAVSMIGAEARRLGAPPHRAGLRRRGGRVDRLYGPPEERDGIPEAEVGYGLVEDARGHGAATEALRGLLLETDRIGVRVRAGVSPDNAPSLRVLAKCGFTQLRGTDEDGHLVMGRPLPLG